MSIFTKEIERGKHFFSVVFSLDFCYRLFGRFSARGAQKTPQMYFQEEK
jgi:hypothetical protein